MSSTNARPRKKARLILFPLVVWVTLVFLVIWPWAYQIDLHDWWLSSLAHLSAFIWWLVLLWALHHLVFQLGGLFKREPAERDPNPQKPPIVVLYTTCDDFDENCCFSCLNQEYDNFKLLICDDNSKDIDRIKIKKFIKNLESKHRSKCKPLRRDHRQGFKAGNLNYAINELKKDKVEGERWILLVDADQVLDPKYISDFVRHLPPDPDRKIAYVQAAHRATPTTKENMFQYCLSPEVALYYFRDLSIRNCFGFVPCLGHGVMMSESALHEVGGFPEVVSEDFAFSLRVANKGLEGRYIEDVESQESFPYDFGGFVIRLKKFAGGTAELCWLRKSRSLGGEGREESDPQQQPPGFGLRSLLTGPASAVEKWDFLMMLLWYLLMPLVTLNGFLGAYVCHRLWSSQLPYLHPVLPYLYSWMIVCILTLHVSVARNVQAAMRFYFWSTAIYTAAMPIAGWSFIKHLFVSPNFERTPKNGKTTSLPMSQRVCMVILGVFAIVFSVVFWSPFTPVLFGQGLAYMGFSFYGWLDTEPVFRRATARIFVYLPGLLMLAALCTMWIFGRY